MPTKRYSWNRLSASCGKPRLSSAAACTSRRGSVPSSGGNSRPRKWIWSEAKVTHGAPWAVIQLSNSLLGNRLGGRLRLCGQPLQIFAKV